MILMPTFSRKCIYELLFRFILFISSPLVLIESVLIIRMHQNETQLNKQANKTESLQIQKQINEKGNHDSVDYTVQHKPHLHLLSVDYFYPAFECMMLFNSVGE